jgi:hypothetical protein
MGYKVINMQVKKQKETNTQVLFGRTPIMGFAV